MGDRGIIPSCHNIPYFEDTAHTSSSYREWSLDSRSSKRGPVTTRQPLRLRHDTSSSGPRSTVIPDRFQGWTGARSKSAEEKISREFLSRLGRLDSGEVLAVIVVIDPDDPLRSKEPARRQSRSTRALRYRQRRRDARLIIGDIDEILDRWGGRRISDSIDRIGGLRVAATRDAVTRLAQLNNVTAVLEDQAVGPVTP